MSENGPGGPNSSTESSDKEFVCPTCGRDFDTKTGVATHHRKGHGEPIEVNFVCGSCGEKYKTKEGFKDHLTNSCPEEGYGCDHCNRVLPNKRGYYHHMKEIHNDPIRVELECANCGTVDKVQPWKGEETKQHENYYCSRKCAGEATAPEAAPDVILECTICGEDYPVRPYRADTSIVCGPDCRYEYMSGLMSGSNNHEYIDGRSGLGYGPNWEEQAEKRRKIDDYTCQGCGKAQEDYWRALSVHHITHRSYFVEGGELDCETANDTSNLVTMCIPCHRNYERMWLRPKVI